MPQQGERKRKHRSDTQPAIRPVLRKDGRDKLLGRARYVDDLSVSDFPEMLHGVTVRSNVPRGRIRNISFEGDLPWNEITVVTAKDLPGPNHIAHIFRDQPCLADQVVKHCDEPILLLAHPDRHLLEEARRRVRIEWETATEGASELAPILSMEESLAQGAQKKNLIWGADNIFKSYLIEKGNPDPVWSQAALVLEGEYATGAQEQLYLETNGMIAVANPEDGVTVRGSMQCPFYVRHALAELFELPEDRVRVVQMETGGGFGGKEDYPSVLACHAALLAWKSGKPVKMIYDRAEDMAATTKRHPSRTRLRTAVDRDGKLLAMDVDFVLDGGAYVTLSPVVLSRGVIHAAGPYQCPHVRIRGRVVATNHPPFGAFRGFGVPQSCFALERHLDRVAEKLGMDPAELRRRNLIGEGQLSATGQLIRENPDLPGLLDAALKASDYEARKKSFAEWNRAPGQRIKKGMGLSIFMHGAGFTGSGEKFLSSVAAVEATAKGQVRVLVSSAEMGQGPRTVLAKIAADALGVNLERVEVVQPDTSVVPNSGPTVASRTTMIVGKLVEDAARNLKRELIQKECLAEEGSGKSDGKPGAGSAGSNGEVFRKACAKYIAKFGKLRGSSQYQQPEFVQWDEQTHRGDAYGTFAWAVYVAEASVDTLTFEARVENFVAAQEIGKVMHPVLAAGQIEGGVVQGIGYALYENVVWKNGHMANNGMTNYIVPTAADIPPIRVIFAENPYRYGPQGAKGIGELPLDGVAPAVVNAVAAATGAVLTEVPVLPEVLMKAMAKPAGEVHE